MMSASMGLQLMDFCGMVVDLDGEDWLVGVGIELRRMSMMVALRVEVDP